MRKQSGFTLVEIAIVLVIIGLILGGVLKGQGLIENARYKNFIKEVDSYRAMFNTFLDTYRSFPGDMSRTNARRLLNAGASGPATSNQSISGGYCDRNNEESCFVWSHLRYAGLASGDPTAANSAARPLHAFGGGVSIATGAFGNRIRENKLLLQSVPGDVAQRYDEEFDDGNATADGVARIGGSGNIYNLATLVNLAVSL